MASNSQIVSWFVAAAAALSWAGCMTADDDELGTAEHAVSAGKRTICHYNGQGVAHEITVSENAVPAHFANHGDHDRIEFFADHDSDGFGAGDAILACSQPAGTSTNDDDCNDDDAGINPAAAEVCDDGIDNNCDGRSATSDTYYADADGDGYGAGAPILVCEAPQPEGTSTNADDCNDSNGAVNPGAAEVCGDNTDNDCDGAFAPAQAVFMFASSNGQQFNGGPGCTYHRDVTVQVCRETPTQQVKLSSTADGSGSMYYDEIGRVVVTSLAPGGESRGANYRWWQATCLDPAYPNVPVGTSPIQLDISNLFGAQYGQFNVNVRVANAHQPYQWFTTWVVPIN